MFLCCHYWKKWYWRLHFPYAWNLGPLNSVISKTKRRMPGREKRREGGHTFCTSVPGSLPELFLYHLSWVSITPVGQLLVLPFCRWESWGSENLSTILKCTGLASSRNWTLAASPERELMIFLERTFLHLEGPGLKCPYIVPILLRGRHCLESRHRLLPRGVRGSFVMDCTFKIRILAFSQKPDEDLLEQDEDFLEQGGAFLCFKHTLSTCGPLVMFCSQALLKSLLRSHLSGRSPPTHSSSQSLPDPVTLL